MVDVRRLAVIMLLLAVAVPAHGGSVSSRPGISMNSTWIRMRAACTVMAVFDLPVDAQRRRRGLP